MTHSNVRHLRRVTPPLASYLRVGARDAPLMTRLLEQGLPVGAGIIVDPSMPERTLELRTVTAEHAVELILDTRAVELSTVGGFALKSVAKLPWALDRPHVPSDFAGAELERILDQIVRAAMDQRVSAVLAPTHFLDPLDTWFDIDGATVAALRQRLDANGAGTITLYYPLVAPLKLLRDEAKMNRIVAGLAELVRHRQIDGVFLRVQGFGTNQAGSRNLRSYIRVARRLHEVGVPIVGERTGCIGVALAAFGAVGGIESSITYGETYDARRLAKPPKGTGFVPPPRAYIAAAMALVDVAPARSILERRGMSRLACQIACCNGRRDGTVADPRRHFVVTRANELAEMSSVIHVTERAENYLTTRLQPARDNAGQIARFDPTLQKHRERLDDWNLALNRTLAEDRANNPTASMIPTGARLRRGA